MSASDDAAPFEWGSVAGAWNRFFYSEMDARPLALMRIAYAVLLLINMLVLAPDLVMWFSEDGVLPLLASRQIVDPDTWTLFSLLPTSTSVLWACYLVCLAQIVLLGLGIWPRIQAACLFVWLISFQHRFIILFDGEDALFRLMVFFFIFAPIGDFYSVDAWWARRRGKVPPPRAVWPLRLIQIEISLIYVSTVLLKLIGHDWVSGDALYYVSRLDDLYGHFPVPRFVFESMLLVRMLSWSVLLVEGVTPFVLWFRETRRTALVIAFAFHFATDWAMNLFLFQWLMMVGLLSFTVPADWVVLKRRVRQIATLAHLRKDQAATLSARVVFILLLLCPLGSAANAATTRVVFLGDSITLGEGVRREENFVSLLAAANSQWDTLNQGRSGWSTSMYLERRQQVVSLIPHDVGTILVLLGTNDIRESHSDAAADVARQMDRLTDLLHRRAPNAEIVLMTPLTVFPSQLSWRLRRAGFDEKSPDHLRLVGSALRDLAKRKGYRCVDLYQAVTAGNTLDGVHPNAAGHRQIRDAILNALRDR